MYDFDIFLLSRNWKLNTQTPNYEVAMEKLVNQSVILVIIVIMYSNNNVTINWTRLAISIGRLSEQPPLHTVMSICADL